MRILFVGINFWPEPTGIGKYSGEMAEFLQRAGHQVTVITAPPYYPHWNVQPPYRSWKYQKEVWNGVTIIRCPLYVPRRVTGATRLIHLLSFTFLAMPVILAEMFKRPEIIFNVAPTLFSANVASYALKKNRNRNWLHIQDFELDAALSLGLLRRLPFIEKMARFWEKSVYRRFGTVSTISYAMLEKLKTKGVDAEKTAYFPNWIDPSRIFPLTGENPYRKSLGFSANDVVLLYSGSIGQKQGIETMIETMRLLEQEKQIHLVICGEGPGKAALVESARGLENIHFLPVQPAEQLNELLNMANIHVLPQKAGAADLVMPSKLLGMLASGRAVVAACPEGSELYRIVSQTGLVVPPEDPAAFAAAISRLASGKNLRDEMGEWGRIRVESDFSADRILNEIEQRFQMITGSVNSKRE